MQATGSVIAAHEIVEDEIEEEMPQTLRVLPSTRSKQVLFFVLLIQCNAHFSV